MLRLVISMGRLEWRLLEENAGANSALMLS
jgi:hypothetical protein